MIFQANGGVDTESSYPYEGHEDTCHFKRRDVGETDKGFVDIPAGSERALKKAVATVGPVSVAIDASHESFQFYSHGVYDEPECDPEGLDHGVLVVGYGTYEGDVSWHIFKLTHFARCYIAPWKHDDPPIPDFFNTGRRKN